MSRTVSWAVYSDKIDAFGQILKRDIDGAGIDLSIVNGLSHKVDKADGGDVFRRDGDLDVGWVGIDRDWRLHGRRGDIEEGY